MAEQPFGKALGMYFSSAFLLMVVVSFRGRLFTS